MTFANDTAVVSIHLYEYLRKRRVNVNGFAKLTECCTQRVVSRHFLYDVGSMCSEYMSTKQFAFIRLAAELHQALRLVHRNGFNIAAMRFDPEMIYNAIKKYKPEFEMVYDVDPLKQSIAESWPNLMDDSCARQDWDWEHKYGLEEMTKDMLEKLSKKLL